MSAAENVLKQGLQLPPEDRLRIAQQLWESLPAENQFEFDDEFWAEMDRRRVELEQHPERALTHEEVMASVEEAIRCVSATTPAPAKN
jgi:putative addiction module component (TIGR02574 family)